MKTDIICTRLASIDGVNTVFVNLEAYVKNTEAVDRLFTSFARRSSWPACLVIYLPEERARSKQACFQSAAP